MLNKVQNPENCQKNLKHNNKKAIMSICFRIIRHNDRQLVLARGLNIGF